MRIVWKHGTNSQTAVEVIERLLPGMLKRYREGVPDHTLTRKDDTWAFSGGSGFFSVSGRLHVDETELTLDVDGIPFPFQGKARSKIERWLAENWPHDAKE